MNVGFGLVDLENNFVYSCQQQPNFIFSSETDILDMVNNFVNSCQQQPNSVSSSETDTLLEKMLKNQKENMEENITENMLKNFRDENKRKGFDSVTSEEMFADALKLSLAGNLSSQPPRTDALPFNEPCQAEPRGIMKKEINPLVSQEARTGEAEARIGEAVEQLDISEAEGSTQITSRRDFDLICGDQCTMEEAEFEGLALYGKIRGKNPTLGKMEEWARKNWEGLQGERFDIDQLANGWFGFKFTCSEDADLIHSKVWTYGKTLFNTKKWTRSFDAETNELDTIPIWVRLPGLPWERWNPKSLRDIGNRLGTFIDADYSFQETHIKKVAKIQIFLKDTASLPKTFNFLFNGKVKRQQLYYEGLSCHKCYETNHSARNCPNVVPSTTTRRNR